MSLLSNPLKVAKNLDDKKVGIVAKVAKGAGVTMLNTVAPGSGVVAAAALKGVDGKSKDGAGKSAKPKTAAPTVVEDVSGEWYEDPTNLLLLGAAALGGWLLFA